MQIFHAFDNVFGGHDYNVDGHNYHTEHNVFNGQNIYEDGKLAATTHHNVFGGQDYYDDKNGLVATSHHNIFGGHDVYSTKHGYEGSTHHTVAGMNYIDHSGVHSFTTDHVGNATTILGYSDPLAHAGNYIMPSMVL